MIGSVLVFTVLGAHNVVAVSTFDDMDKCKRHESAITKHKKIKSHGCFDRVVDINPTDGNGKIVIELVGVGVER